MSQIMPASINLIQDLGSITKRILISDPFYGLFLSTLDKRESKDIPLAAVSLNKSTMDFALLINPDEWSKYSPEVKYGVLLHEVKHLTSFHLLTMDMYPNDKMDNVACDCEINQTIEKMHLPPWGIFLDDLKEKHPKLDWKPLAGRAHYYKELSKLSKEEQAEMGIDENAEHQWEIVDGDGNEIDKLTDAEKASISAQVQSTIEEMADAVKKRHGSLPSEIEDLINGFVKPKPVFNYTKFLRTYVGNSTRYTIGTSKIRENLRFPGQPKIILKPIGKMLILIDESGSVSQNELYDFLNEIYHLRKKVDIEIRAFDTEVGKIVNYKGNNEFPRTNCGGTNFTAAVEFYKASKYTSCIIFTDGYAETPPPCGKRLLWVISSNGEPDAIQNHSKWIKIPNTK